MFGPGVGAGISNMPQWFAAVLSGAAVTEIPLTDYFDGTGLNSSALNDPYFFTRWDNESGGGGALSFLANRLRCTGTGATSYGRATGNISHTGAFCVTAKIASHTGIKSTTWLRYTSLKCTIGGANKVIARAVDEQTTGDHFFSVNGATVKTSASSLSTNYYVRLIRDAANEVLFQYSANGTAWTTVETSTITGTLTAVFMTALTGPAGSPTVDTSVEYIEANDNANGDGTGDDIMVDYVDPLSITFSGAASLDPVITGGTNIVWHGPSGQTSTGGTPSPALAEAGTWYVTMDDYSAVTEFDVRTDTVTAIGNLNLATELTRLFAFGNAGFTDIDVSSNTKLTLISVYLCGHTDLNFSSLPVLDRIDGYNMPNLQTINILSSNLVSQLYLRDSPNLDVDSLVEDIYETRGDRPAMTVTIDGSCPAVSAGSVTKITELVASYGHTWFYNT